MDFSLDTEKIFNAGLEWGSTYLPRIVAAIVILVVGWWLVNKTARILSALMRRGKVDETLVGFLENIVYYTLLALVFVTTLSQLGVNIASFLAILGAAGLAIGLALKETLANFASGVILILFAPFRIGDVINVAGITGTVGKISVFHTVVNTSDNQRIIVPNGKIANDVIVNINANSRRRVDLTVGIGYGDDIAEARNVMMSIVDNDERILSEPKPGVVVSELGESCVNLSLRVWVRTNDYFAVLFELNEKIKVRFDEAGISIPFPQREVHLVDHSK